MNIKLIISLILAATSLNINAQNNLVGKPAPMFTGQAVFPDGSVRHFDLADYQGQNIVLYFYPMDNTPGCTIQAKKFRDDIQKLRQANIMVIGISCDPIKSHLNFQKKHALPYVLVSDSRWKRTISKAYGAAGFLYSQRKTFLINQDGIIFQTFDHVDIQNQINDILRSFAAQSN